MGATCSTSDSPTITTSGRGPRRCAPRELAPPAVPRPEVTTTVEPSARATPERQRHRDPPGEHAGQGIAGTDCVWSRLEDGPHVRCCRPRTWRRSRRGQAGSRWLSRSTVTCTTAGPPGGQRPVESGSEVVRVSRPVRRGTRGPGDQVVAGIRELDTDGGTRGLAHVDRLHAPGARRSSRPPRRRCARGPRSPAPAG